MSITLSHSDTVSGTTICEDGTKVYWTEGFSQAVIIRGDDGFREKVDANSNHPVLKRREIAECLTTASRGMTIAEEVEWQIAMYTT
jgi:hypothetical protein